MKENWYNVSIYVYKPYIEDVVTINNTPSWNLIQHLGMWVPSLQHIIIFAFELCVTHSVECNCVFSNIERML